MTSRLFFEAMGEVSDQFYMEAAEYQVEPSKTSKRRILRLFVRVAVAAILIAALTVTAYAVYQALLKDYFLHPASADTTQPTPKNMMISLVGYQI